MKLLRIKDICIGAVVWMLLMTAAVIIPNTSPWLGTPLVLIGIILIPGSLMALNFGISTNSKLLFTLYGTALGFALLTFGGLFVNWALPYFGVAHPLGRVPLTVFFDIVVFLLALRTYLFKKNLAVSVRPIRLDGINLFFGIIPLFFITASVYGAAILNAGGKGTLTLIMLFAIAIYVVILIAFRDRVSGWVYVESLYAIALSVLLMYSLRSGHILGWDINQEYEVFRTTLQNLRWSPLYFPGLDYNACTSITILPTIFRSLINIPAEYVYKTLFQLIFAVTPVMVFAFARRYLERPLAFLAAFALIAQTWFFEQMPALIRQEVAFLFFIAVILALFDEQLSRRSRSLLFYIFTASVVVSHYSTAYVWLGLLLIVLTFSYIGRLFSRSLRKKPMTITPVMFVVSVAFLLLWQFPLTATAGKVTKFATNTNGQKPPPAQVAGATSSGNPASLPGGSAVGTAALIALSPIISPPGGEAAALYHALLATFFASGNPNTDANVATAQTHAIHSYGPQAGYLVYQDASSSGYKATAINENTQLAPKLPQFLANTINFLALADRFIFINIFTVIGIIGSYFAIRRRPAENNGRYDFVLLSVGAYLLIVLMLLIPYLQAYYNLTRLYLQMFIILTVLAVAGGAIATKYFPRHQLMILAIMTVLMFCSLSGAIEQLTGGGARITLNQPPSTLDTPYLHDPEIAGAQWLGTHRDPAAPIQTDDVANLRLQSFGGVTLSNSAIFPQTIERDSYVYLIDANISDGRAFYQYSGNVLVYNYPLDFLNVHKNLIYNAGGSRIYH